MAPESMRTSKYEVVSKCAAKARARIDAPTRQRIVQAIGKIPQGDIKPLKGTEDSYRLRVGSWRILYSTHDGDTILIEKVGPRGDVYKEV